MEQLQVERAGELLLRYGPKSISMDDIASHLGISKRTIYKEFSRKEEIVERVMKKNIAEFRQKVAEARVQAQHAVEESLLVMEKLVQVSGLMKAGFGAEMTKFFPETWLSIEREWLDLLGGAIAANLRRGIAEGVYRPDLEIDFVVQLRQHQIQSIFGGEPFGTRATDMGTVFFKLTHFYLHAICTEQGRTKIWKLKEAGVA